MAETSIRVRVISSYYGPAMKVNSVGDVLELHPNLARELIASNRVVRDDTPPAKPKVEAKETKA